jgi:nucleoside phosphorylase
LESLRELFPGLLAVEMEGGGVAIAAVQVSDPPGFLMIRSISDLADKRKNSPKTVA